MKPVGLILVGKGRVLGTIRLEVDRSTVESLQL